MPVLWRHGLEDNAGRGLRRVRASVDTGDSEPVKLPPEEMSLNVVEQGRRGRQDAGSTDQDRA